MLKGGPNTMTVELKQTIQDLYRQLDQLKEYL